MTFWQYIQCGWKGLTDLFYPHCCWYCGQKLDDYTAYLCPDCEAHLPRTEMAHMRDNKVELLFWDIQKFVRGGAFCFYGRDECFRSLIRRLKYSSSPEIGTYLGHLAAREFMEKGFFQDIDVIVPVPLHPKRERKRGYNQAEMIARGLSAVTGIPVDTMHLCRTKNNATQTRKQLQERADNTQGIFSLCHPENWRNKHILLVDDVITTGSTLRSCMKVLTPVRGTRISVFALGFSSSSPLSSQRNTLSE